MSSSPPSPIQMSDEEVDEEDKLVVTQLPRREPLMRSVSDFGFSSNRVRRNLLEHLRPKLPISPRHRTISLNQNLVNTEREPILRDEKSNKTIFVQGIISSRPFIAQYVSKAVSRETTLVFKRRWGSQRTLFHRHQWRERKWQDNGCSQYH